MKAKDNELSKEESDKIINALKKVRPATKKPRNKLFLTPDGEWIQLEDKDSHWSIVPFITEKVTGKSPHTVRPEDHMNTGLMRVIEYPTGLNIHGTKHLNNAQIREIRDTLIEKGIDSNDVNFDFNDISYESKLPRVLCAY